MMMMILLDTSGREAGMCRFFIHLMPKYGSGDLKILIPTA